MKKIAILALCACLFLTLFTPASAFAENAPTEKLRVVSTIFPPYDFVRAIAGDAVALDMLLPPGSESHSFEPSPQDIIKIQNSDIFLYIGGETDAWIDRILESIDTSTIRMMPLLDMVEAVSEAHVEGMQDDHDHEDHAHDEDEAHEDHDHEEEHEHGEEALDEHVWTSPKNAMTIVDALADALSELDAANAVLYRENADAYLAELSALDAAFVDATANAARDVVIFGDRFPFRYLADAYGLRYYAAFPGCATETEASAATIAFLIDKAVEEEVPAVFHIEFSNEKIVDALAESASAKKLLLHSCHNVSKQDFEAGVTYLDLMRTNAKTLKEALN